MSEAGLNEADITTAVLVFAHYLGIDLETESELLPIAEKALRNLPQGWELGIGDNENAGIPYFFNESTGESVWKHPKEGVYLKKVKEEKKRLQIEADDRKRNRKAEGAASGRNQAQSQQRNQSDRDRGHDDGNKGNKNDVNKTRSGKGQSTADDVEIIEVSDFFQDDEEEYSQKSSMKKNTAANAVVGKKKDSDGPTYGMSAADFLSDDEEEEEKGASNDHPLKDTNAKGKKNSTQWNEANSHLEKEKEIRNVKSSRSESISWDDKSSGSAHMSVGVSRHDNESRGGDSGSGSVIRGREEVVRGKDNRGSESNRIESAGSLSTRSNSPLPSKMDAREKSRERISKERDIRERESKDRDLREKESKEKESRERESRELREKDIREAELREREKNRVRMRDLEGSNAVASSALSAEVSALKADNRDLEDRLSDLRHRHQQELEVLRASNMRLDERLTDEKEGRKDAEERLSKSLSEGDSRIRDSEEAADSKIRENQRKAKADADEEWKERMKTIERRNILELEEARAEIITQKKKYDQSQELLDETKKKLSLSREDGKLEGKAEVDSARAIARDLEAQLRAQVNEFKKHREDHASIAGRLASALQTAQVAMAECEAAKAQANGAISEGQTSHSALIQATHRMQQLDQECVALKTEYLMLRTENDTQAGEIRKLMNVSGINGDKLAETYADFKRLKANSQAESSRQCSRIAELEALSTVLRTQLDLSATTEATTLRDLQRLLDKAEFEKKRVEDRLAHAEALALSESARVTSLEKEARTFEEMIHKRDRTVREEKQKSDDSEDRLEGVRAAYESEIDLLKTSLRDEKALNTETARKHKIELEELKKDIAEKVPKIVSTAVERVESQLALRVEKEVSSAKIRYEHQTERVKQELLEFQGGQAEREARHRVAHAEEKAELDRLRYHSQRLQRRVDELEEENGELKSSRRRKTDRQPILEIEDRSTRYRSHSGSRSGSHYSNSRGERERGKKHHSGSGRDNESYSEGDESKYEENRSHSGKSNHNQSNQGNNDRSASNQSNNGNSNNNNGDGSRNGNNNQNQNRKNDDNDNNGNRNANGQNNNNNNSNNRQEIEETLAMQTMSLIHGQLTAMKQQLLTISDSPLDPYPMDVSQSQRHGQGQGQNNSSSSYTSGSNSNNNSVRDPPGVLHASEQAIQRMFRSRQQQQNTQPQSQNQFYDRSMNLSHTYPGQSGSGGSDPSSNSNGRGGSGSGSGSGSGGRSFSNTTPSSYDPDTYNFNANNNKVTFSPESLMLTPMEKDRGQKHYSTSASILNPMDVSTSNSNSNTVLPQPSAFLASSMGMGVGADRVSEREREDLSGGFGASSLSFEEVQDGGYHEGYWRSKYQAGGSPVRRGGSGSGSGGSLSMSAVRMR